MTLFYIYLAGFVITAFGFGWGGDLRTPAEAMISVVMTIIWPITWVFVLFAGIGASVHEWTLRD